MADTDTAPTEGNTESTTDTPEPTEGTGEATETEVKTEPSDDLLAKLRSKTTESTKYQKRAQKAEAELEKLRQASLSEQEKAVEAARTEGLSEGRAAGDKRLIRAEVLIAAAGKAADPTDVYALLNARGSLAGIEVADDGSMDTKAITAAVDALLAEKKHLAAGPQSRDPDFGARSPTTPQMSTDQAFAAWLDSQRR